MRAGKIIPTLIVPISEHKNMNYYSDEAIEKYAKEFNWRIIDNDTKKELFMEYVKDMDMSYSYKPILLKAIFEHIDSKGRVNLEDIVNYFIDFYADRKLKGLIIEKPQSIFTKEFTIAEARRNILSNPFKRFEQMSMLRHTKTLGIIELDAVVYRKLTKEDINWITEWCDNKLQEYYDKLTK